MLRTLIRASGQHIIFPLYHTINDDPGAHVRHLYRVKGMNQFRRDLNFIQRHYSQLDFSEYFLQKKCHRSQAKPYFHLTFDDGMREVYDIIAPELMKRKLNAILFINNAYIDNKDLFYRFKASLLIDELMKNKGESTLLKAVRNEFRNLNLTNDEAIKMVNLLRYIQRESLDRIASEAGYNFQEYLKEHKPYMTLKQLQELENNGFIIGAHSVDHPYFQDIIFDEQIRQIGESLAFISAHLQTTYKLFAFPFTDYKLPRHLFQNIFDEKIADFTFGTAGLKKDTFPRSIQRISFEKKPYYIRGILYKAYIAYLTKRLTGKHVYDHS